MKYTQEDLGLIEKHVEQGKKNVRQQRQIVRVLRKGGYPTDEALEILATLEAALHVLRERRGRIRTEIRSRDPRSFSHTANTPEPLPIRRVAGAVGH